MKTKEELQTIYTGLAAELGQVEYTYLLAKQQILVKIDEVQKEFVELSKLPKLPTDEA